MVDTVTLGNKIKSLPVSLQNEVVDYVDDLLSKINCKDSMSEENIESTEAELDALCGSGGMLWKEDPQEYVRALRDNDRI
jgi:hypothetical protein